MQFSNTLSKSDLKVRVILLIAKFYIALHCTFYKPLVAVFLLKFKWHNALRIQNGCDSNCRCIEVILGSSIHYQCMGIPYKYYSLYKATLQQNVESYKHSENLTFVHPISELF